MATTMVLKKCKQKCKQTAEKVNKQLTYSGSTGPKISSFRILCSSLMPLIRVRMYEMFEVDIGIAFGAEKKIIIKC